MTEGGAGPVKVGLGLLEGTVLKSRREFLAATGDAGIDRVVNWDHVTFRGGWGTDGLVASAADLSMHESIGAFVSVYLLALRHPVLVARQISTIADLAPDRLVLGAGIGGDDRHEVRSAGVDPRTRGRRMEECLTVLGGLLRGEEISFEGEFFTLEDVRILPTPAEPVPIVVGGRSDAAVLRAGRLGDGWIGVWNSVRRYVEASDQFEQEAARVGRAAAPRQHTMQIWVGMGESVRMARSNVAAGVHSYIKLPFESFERYCTWGAPETIAQFAMAYLDAGCRNFNFVGCATDPTEAVDVIGQVAEILRAEGVRRG